MIRLSWSLAALIALFGLPAAAQGAEDGQRCGHRQQELLTLFSRAGASEQHFFSVMAGIGERLEGLLNSETPVCEAGETADCIHPDQGLNRNSADSEALGGAYAAYRAQRLQYNEYLDYFDTTCVQAGHSGWISGTRPPLWEEHEEIGESAEFLRDILAAERDWLRGAQ